MPQTEWSTIEPTKGEEQEKVEFEIEGQEEEQQQPEKVEAVAPQPEEQTQQAAEEEKTPEELEGIETSGAQKRIRQLVKQKKEREEEIEKLVAANKEMQLKLQSQEDEYKKALVDNATSSEGQVQERLELARDAYKRAVDSGDSDLILRAQEALNSAQQDTTRFADYKKQLDSYTVQQPQQQQEVPVQQQPQQQQNPTYEGYDMKAVQWASKNEWFNSDQIMTAAALTIDAQLKEEGYDPTDDEFYEEVDKRLAQTFPHKFGGNTATNPVPQETSQPAQVVAGASRTPSTSSSKKVKLTQEDVRLADKWGISLEQYAAEKLKVERAEGEYTTINR